MRAERYTVLRTRVLENYHQLDITNHEMMLLIHIVSFQAQGEDFPALSRLKERMNYSDTEIYAGIEGLIDKNIIQIKTHKNQQGQVAEYYSLAPLYYKLDQLKQVDNHEQEARETAEKEESVFNLIQDEFSRQLSPIEYQMVAEWMTKDHFDPDTIKEAVKEAVLNQAYSLRYINRILIDWRKKGKKTAFRHQASDDISNKLPPVSLEKWIDD